MAKSYNILNWSKNCEFPWKLVEITWEYTESKWSCIWLAITSVASAKSRISLKNNFQSHTLTWACIIHTSAHTHRSHMTAHTPPLTQCMFVSRDQNQVSSVQLCVAAWSVCWPTAQWTMTGDKIHKVLNQQKYNSLTHISGLKLCCNYQNYILCHCKSLTTGTYLRN